MNPKNKIRISLILTILSLGVLISPAQSITTNIPLPAIPGLNLDILTNMPTSTNFATASFAVDAGVIARSSTVENALKLDTYWKTNWMLSAEMQFNPSTSVVMDSASIMGGYRKPWTSAEVYAEVGGRRTWSTDITGVHPTFQGLGLIGASARPITGNPMLSFVELRFLTSATGSVLNTKPSVEFLAGFQLKL